MVVSVLALFALMIVVSVLALCVPVIDVSVFNLSLLLTLSLCSLSALMRVVHLLSMYALRPCWLG